MFLRLDDRVEAQFALPIVRKAGLKLRWLIDRYNRRRGSKKLTVDEVRARFLAFVFQPQLPPETRSLATNFVAYVLELDYRSRMLGLTRRSSYDPFFAHLLRGWLLFESLLKLNPMKTPTAKTLRPIINKVLKNHLGLKREVKTTATHFDVLLRRLASTRIHRMTW